MDFPLLMMMEPGAIGIMSYAHHNVEEPAILIGMGFPQTKKIDEGTSQKSPVMIDISLN
jgi:hypothetical protein